MKHIPSPVDFFGFEPGEDRHMIHWNDLCAYYRLLDSLSGRIKLVEAGKLTEEEYEKLTGEPYDG